jgi:ribonuclease HII
MPVMGKDAQGRTHAPVAVRALLADAIGGVDEAGRGPLAGSVVAAAVLLRPGQIIPGVRDSKQLSAARRQALVPVIKQQALGWALGSASVAEIDQFNILQATLLAMSRAVAALGSWPALLQVDGNRLPRLPDFPGRLEAVVGGDRHCQAIAAASILAKVSRDEEMLAAHQQFPHYGFDQHKGYPTATHLQALQQCGPCILHRRSFAPVCQAMAVA